MVPTARFLQLRDGHAAPETEEEMLELARFTFRCESAGIEQAQAQRRRPSFDNIRQMEIAAVQKIIKIYDEYRKNHEK